jgi:hypothetical protein
MLFPKLSAKKTGSVLDFALAKKTGSVLDFALTPS